MSEMAYCPSLPIHSIEINKNNNRKIVIGWSRGEVKNDNENISEI